MDLFQKIKQLFSVEETANFADAKTDGGKILKISPALEEKAVVEIVSEDGSTELAPAGDHTLDNGTVVTVGEQGVISKIEVKSEVESEEETEMSEVAVEEVKEVSEEKSEVSDVEARLSNLEKAMEMLIQELTKANEMKAAELSKTKEEAVEKAEFAKVEVEKELSKIKTELARYKSAPALSFKATVAVDKPGDAPKAELSPMQIRLAALKEKNQ